MDPSNNFFSSYREAAKKTGLSGQAIDEILHSYSKLVEEQRSNPFKFAAFHEAQREPFDYYQFGLEFIRSLMLLDQSTVSGDANLRKMEELIAKGENVILFGNHQIEPDPQAIDLLLRHHGSEFGEKIIFVAGHRVTSDPFAAPLSRGRRLLCIHSKKYIEHPPEEKEAKIAQNQATLRQMRQMLDQGGSAIFVAPSGGRDRRNEQGSVVVAPFDPQSIEMFYLMAKSSSKPTHFFPLALDTYHLLPPPDILAHALGEERKFAAHPCHLFFGDEIDMEASCGEAQDKKERRSHRAEAIWSTVNYAYNKWS
jgi:glycerol-3-phosphate O-acyltransferase